MMEMIEDQDDDNAKQTQHMMPSNVISVHSSPDTALDISYENEMNDQPQMVSPQVEYPLFANYHNQLSPRSKVSTGYEQRTSKSNWSWQPARPMQPEEAIPRFVYNDNLRPSSSELQHTNLSDLGSVGEPESGDNTFSRQRLSETYHKTAQTHCYDASNNQSRTEQDVSGQDGQADQEGLFVQDVSEDAILTDPATRHLKRSLKKAGKKTTIGTISGEDTQKVESAVQQYQSGQQAMNTASIGTGAWRPQKSKPTSQKKTQKSSDIPISPAITAQNSACRSVHTSPRSTVPTMLGLKAKDTSKNIGLPTYGPKCTYPVTLIKKPKSRVLTDDEKCENKRRSSFNCDEGKRFRKSAEIQLKYVPKYYGSKLDGYPANADGPVSGYRMLSADKAQTAAVKAATTAQSSKPTAKLTKPKAQTADAQRGQKKIPMKEQDPKKPSSASMNSTPSISSTKCSSIPNADIDLSKASASIIPSLLDNTKAVPSTSSTTSTALSNHDSIVESEKPSVERKGLALLTPRDRGGELADDAINPLTKSQNPSQFSTFAGNLVYSGFAGEHATQNAPDDRQHKKPLFDRRELVEFKEESRIREIKARQKHLDEREANRNAHQSPPIPRTLSDQTHGKLVRKIPAFESVDHEEAEVISARLLDSHPNEDNADDTSGTLVEHDDDESSVASEEGESKQEYEARVETAKIHKRTITQAKINPLDARLQRLQEPPHNHIPQEKQKRMERFLEHEEGQTKDEPIRLLKQTQSAKESSYPNEKQISDMTSTNSNSAEPKSSPLKTTKMPFMVEEKPEADKEFNSSHNTPEDMASGHSISGKHILWDPDPPPSKRPRLDDYHLEESSTKIVDEEIETSPPTISALPESEQPVKLTSCRSLSPPYSSRSSPDRSKSDEHEPSFQEVTTTDHNNETKVYSSHPSSCFFGACSTGYSQAHPTCLSTQRLLKPQAVTLFTVQLTILTKSPSSPFEAVDFKRHSTHESLEFATAAARELIRHYREELEAHHAMAEEQHRALMDTERGCRPYRRGNWSELTTYEDDMPALIIMDAIASVVVQVGSIERWMVPEEIRKGGLVFWEVMQRIEVLNGVSSAAHVGGGRGGGAVVGRGSVVSVVSRGAEACLQAANRKARDVWAAVSSQFSSGRNAGESSSGEAHDVMDWEGAIGKEKLATEKHGNEAMKEKEEPSGKNPACTYSKGGSSLLVVDETENSPTDSNNKRDGGPKLSYSDADVMPELFYRNQLFQRAHIESGRNIAAAVGEGISDCSQVNAAAETRVVVWVERKVLRGL